MINDLEKYIAIFNADCNQEISGFGTIDIALHNCGDDFELLFYFYPMIERLMRCILDQSGVFDLENKDNYTYKTLYSIVKSNSKQIKKLFGGELGKEIHYYLVRTYSEKGPRNKVMHYSRRITINKFVVASATYIFEELVQFYVENFCMNSQEI